MNQAITLLSKTGKLPFGGNIDYFTETGKVSPMDCARVFLWCKILQSASGTVPDAFGLKTRIGTIDAQRAFPGLFFLGADMNCPKRAGLYAKAASYAFGVIRHNNVVWSLNQGIFRTNRNTKGIFALHAGRKNKIRVQFTIDTSWLQSYHAAPSGSRGQPVFLFTGHFAGITPDTPVNIHQENFIRHLLLSLPCRAGSEAVSTRWPGLCLHHAGDCLHYFSPATVPVPG